ncbi:MAG TPA: HAD-IA family hydrolase [Acidimicrobiales bacterium]|nr:HAD-IA family hydrolase [Acidimicrobiales bacterium]
MTTETPGASRYYFAGLERLIRARSDAFVGREALLRSLISLASTEGDGGVRVITGPPGSGKTSLLCRLIHELDTARPVHHIVGRDSGRDKPRLILQSLVGQIVVKYGFPLAVADDVDVLARDLSNLLVEIDRRGEREVLVVDGLDEIDIVPLQRVLSLLPAPPPPSTRVFLSVRDGTIEGEIITALDARRISLKPLDLSETVRYAKTTGSSISFERLSDLHESAEGNPLVLKLLLANSVDRDPAIGPSAGTDPMASAIKRVVDRASEQVGAAVTADVLGAIHVAAGEIDRRDLREILEEVSSHDLHRALEAVEELLDHDAVRLAFFHKSVHDYLRDHFTRREVRRFHELIVDWLSQEALDSGSRRSTLINHLLHCDQVDSAIRLLSGAGHVDALRRDLGDGPAFQEWLNDWELARDRVQLDEVGRETIARSLVATASRYFQFLHDNAVFARLGQNGAADELEWLGTSIVEPQEAALVLFLRGAIRYHNGDLEGADVLYEMAQIEVLRAGEASVAFRIHQFRGLAAQYSGRFADALGHYAQSRIEAERTGHPLYHVFSHSCAGNTLTMQARPDAALLEQQRALDLLRDPATGVREDPDLLSVEHFQTNVASALTRIAESHLALGDVQQASSLLAEAASIYDELPSRDRYFLYFVQVSAEVQLQIAVGEGHAVHVDDTRSMVWDAFVLCRTSAHRSRSLRILAGCDLLDGNTSGAEALARQALDMVPERTAPVERMRALLVLADAVASADEAQALRRDARQLGIDLGMDESELGLARDPRISIPADASGPPAPHAATASSIDGAHAGTVDGLVILDCDGVLVDSERISIAHAREVLADLGWEVSDEEIIDRFVGRSDEFMRAAVVERLGRPVPDWDVRYTRSLIERLSREVQPVAGVLAAIDELGSARMCVASSGTHQKLKATLGAVGLLPRFSGRIYSSQDVAAGKPAPDLFLHAAQVEGFEPSACVVVEDSRPGAVAASAAGMGCVVYVGGGLTAESDFDGTGAVTISTMSDLPHAVGSILRRSTGGPVSG